MRIAMLGWEYPPHISGGLGTASEGLSRALAQMGHEITFVLPHLYGGEDAPHMRLLDTTTGVLVESDGTRSVPDPEKFSASAQEILELQTRIGAYSYSRFHDLLECSQFGDGADFEELRCAIVARAKALAHALGCGDSDAPYGADIFEEVDRFAAQVVLRISMGQLNAGNRSAANFGVGDFDVIHAHDWMTFPAAVALKSLTGKPLVVHIHSLEFDRSGDAVNHRIHQIEGLGIRFADRVIAVSHYTASILRQQHTVAADRVTVVHNGVYPQQVQQSYRRQGGWHSQMVLFLGRVTFQKGPDYFVEAAAKALPLLKDVVFVVAGVGDMLPQLQRRVHELGIAEHFRFPGFLRGAEVEEMFSLADLYVMPSVSEPFGISALEAINYDTPVIMSKQTGVSEVVGHALKVDFWDVDRLAEMMVNALRYPELRRDMINMAREELRRVRWESAAIKTDLVYRELDQNRSVTGLINGGEVTMSRIVRLV